MSKGGFRKGSGRKKGSIPWNVGIPMSEESKAKLSQSKKGGKAWNKGIPMREETRLKLSKIRKGRPSPWKGRHPTKTTLHKMRLAKLGKPSNAKGRTVSPEERNQKSVSKRKSLLEANPSYDYRLDSRTRAGNKRIRRERLKKFGGSHSTEEWTKLKEENEHTCPCCKRIEPEIKLTRDHIVALSNGGTDDILNIQPLCVQCNSKKATRTIKY